MARIFIWGEFLLSITVFHASYVDAVCRDLCVGLNASNITGPRWPEDLKKEESSRYPNAAHYWPFNSTSSARTLLDVRGKCKTETYNGVRTKYAEQLGPVLSLDGQDDWIFINGVRSKCINDPTLCSRGLTIAFWIKYHAGEFIVSGGRYTDHQQGPGFRFICSNCASASASASASRTENLKAKRFVLNLSTQTQDWKINLDFLPKAWFHFAFTWHIDHGLRVYKNGKLLVKDTTPQKVKYRPLSPRYETITLGRPNSLSKLHNYGKFDIGHLVIWPYELSAYEVEVAFLTVLAKTTKSLICCHFKKADPCLDNPCYNGASCRSIDEKFQCICPDINQGPCPKRNGVHPCVDKSDTCAMFASQEGYCENNRKYMTLMCAKTCKFCRYENEATSSTVLPVLKTSTAGDPHRRTTQPTRKPLSTPRLSGGTSSPVTKKSSKATDTSSKGTKGYQDSIKIFVTGQSGTIDTKQIPGSTDTGRVDPGRVITQNGGTPLKSVGGSPNTRPSESDILLTNEKTHWQSKTRRLTPAPEASSSGGKSAGFPTLLPSPEPSRSTKTLALSPTPYIANKPSISSHSTGSDVVAREASPSFIDPSVLLTSGTGSRTVVVHPEASRSQKQRTQTLSPTPTPYPTVSQPHFCPLGKGSQQQCVCMNCEGNTANGVMCCIDLLRSKDMNEGITLVVSSLSMEDFLSKVSSLRNLASEIIIDQCSKSPCFEDNTARKKRSNGPDINHGTSSSDQVIKSWDGSPIVPSNTLKPDIRRNAQPASMAAPRIQPPIGVNVVIFKIAKHPNQYQKLYTAFYVSVDGTNETQILKADTLAKLIRTKRDLFKDKLNISIESVAPWSYWSRTFSIGIRVVPSTVGFPSSYGTTVIPGAGTPNVDGQEGGNSTSNMSRSTFIIVLVTGIGGFVVLAIIIIYMLVKFLRRMKGEFVPDKVYPNEQKSNSGSDQLIPQSFIDPSTPRITDVPKKTVRTGASTSGAANGGAGGGGVGGAGGGSGAGSGGGPKKTKKPMGVKVTYKPPKWD